MKRLRFAAVLTVILAFLLSISAYGMSESMPLVIDEADLITDSEEEELQEILSDISNRAKCQIIVYTVDSVGSSDIWEYAKSYFHMCSFGYGEDKSGILLIMSTENRDYAIYTYGKAWEEFDSDALDHLEDEMLSHFRKNDYYKGFLAYANVCEETLIYHFDIALNLLIAVAIGAVISFLILSAMKAKLKTVRPQRAASNYIRSGSFVLTKDYDIYLYRNITRRRRETESSSSSRGGSRSSGGGRRGKY